MDNQNVIYLVIAMQRKCSMACKIQIIGLTDRTNWQDWGGRWTRRTALMRNLKTILEELEVKYTLPVQPILLPANMPPLASYQSNTRPTSPSGFTLSSPGGARTQLRQSPSLSPHSGIANLPDLGNAGRFPSTAR